MLAGRMVNIILCFIAPISIGLLTGCSASAGPSKNDAVRQIGEFVADETTERGMVDVGAISYENGFVRDENNYVVAVKYTITVKQSTEDFKKSIDTFSCSFDWTCGQLLLSSVARREPITKGDSFDIQRQFLFLKTEKGWINQGYLK